MTLDDLVAVLKIILIDIVLSGDNAVVIAMAAHKLPERQRKQAILWGGGIAIFLRIVFTMVMAFILNVPGVRLIGGMVLVFIACKLLLDEEEEAVLTDDGGKRSAMAAIRMIFVADFVMSLDNMLAVAGAAHGSPVKLLMGLFVSIGIIMTCSGYIARLMNRYHWIVLLGAAILALTAGEMMLGDRELGGYVVRSHRISLSKEWETWMLTRAEVKQFQDPDKLPQVVRDVASFEGPHLTFVGQMSVAQRDALLARVNDPQDKAAIEHLYEDSRKRDVPAWVPDNFKQRVTMWFQRKWPAEDWFAVKDHRHYWVSWGFYSLVILFCLSTPYWRRKHPPKEEPATGPTPVV
jgi:YjbE family integral membrane protein